MQSTFTITSASVTDRGLSEKRPQNEDSVLEMPAAGIFAVADGVGGAQAGEVASQMAVEMLGEAFSNKRPEQDAEAVMRLAISQANSAIYQMAQELPQLASMATTIVALHLNHDVATIGHVGDSRLYRVERDGNLFADTEDHSMVADEVRAGRMTPEQAENHPSKNIINRALGAEPSVLVDLKTIMIEPGTAFLLCSDGITRHVTDAEIKGVLTFGGSPSEVCDYLKNLCYERGAEDNLTAVVVKIASDKARTEFAEPAAAIEEEEATVATARMTFDEPIEDDDGELLELETLELDRPERGHVDADQFADTADLQAADTQEIDFDTEPVEVTEDSTPAAEPDPISTVETLGDEEQEPKAEQEFSMFGSSSDSSSSEAAPSSAGKILTAVAMLIIGSLIGLGVYHFVLAPTPVAPTPDERFPVMKTEDISLTSYEKLRRTVDSDPAAYVKEVRPADDAEDFYLIGRAYLLTGDYPRARQAFIEAQKNLATASEPGNVRVLQTDIVTGLMIANDPTIQTRFKQELEATAKMPANVANTNSNR
jgi:serine/threonine protein phosphatase PrpC/cytochrome c-type biogenesis protein CcmH/NrfG